MNCTHTVVRRVKKDHLRQDPNVRTASSQTEAEFVAYHDAGKAVFGSQPELHLILESEEALFHEAAVFTPSDNLDHLFVTSNILAQGNGDPAKIKISKLARQRKDGSTWSHEEIPAGDIVMGNGGVNQPGGENILFCSQGNHSAPSSLVLMKIEPPHTTHVLLNNYHGRPFNSVNDVIFSKDGSIWFTDPNYGHEQKFKPRPRLPCQLYRYDPSQESIRAVADGFGRPNGLCFSPDEDTLYVTDTDWIHGDGTTDDHRVSHIYAFTVRNYHGSPFLTDRRLFAMVDTGAPDGIKCDTQGRVYSGCGDGVNTWLPDGTLVGKVIVPGGVANFCFGRPGEMFLLNETRFWVANIAPDVRGALLEGMGVSV